MRKAALYILLPAALAFALAWLFRPAPDNPPGVDPERYDYPTQAELDSIWLEEAGPGEKPPLPGPPRKK